LKHSGPEAVASLVCRQHGLGNRVDGQRREAILEILPPGHWVKRIAVLARLLVSIPSLDSEVCARDARQNLLQPCPTHWLAAAEVSTLVNPPMNNWAGFLKEVSDIEGAERGLFEP
jgi:hypothetical protein